jgi:broad specificity phosphatase PhoE
VTASVFLVRHASHLEPGRRLTGRGNSTLTAAGQEQALALGERLSKEKISVVYSSPRERARSTALSIADRVGAPVKIVAPLDEIDFGDWTGANFNELEADSGWQSWNKARAASCPPNGETMAAAVGRIVTCLERVVAQHPGSQIVVVSHGDMIRGAIAHYLGIPLDNILRFAVEPASFSRLMIGAWGAQVVSVNETIGE